MGQSCESCLMPLRKDPGPRESERYCSYCFKGGALCYPGTDLNEFQRRAYEAMVAHGTGRIAARVFTFLIRFAPRWRAPKK